MSCDDGVAAKLGLRHLIQLGHSRIGMLLGPLTTSRQSAAAAVDGVMVRVGREPVEREHSAYSLQAGQAAGARLLAKGVTSVI